MNFFPPASFANISSMRGRGYSSGLQFTADEFRTFMRSNGIKHIRSAPYHPATNGIAERFVQTFKQALRAALTEKQTISRKLTNFLLAYRTTPHALTGESPAVLLMGRNLRTRLDILKPNIRKRVEEKQQDQELRSSRNPTRELGIGQTVMARNYRTKEKWVPGVITAHPGPLSYEVSVAPNTVWRRHIDQLKETAVTPNITKEHCTPQLDPAVLVGIPQATSSIGSVEEPQPPLASNTEEVPTINRDEISSSNNSPSSPNEIMISCSATPPPRRYPLRLRKPPEKLNL